MPHYCRVVPEKHIRRRRYRKPTTLLEEGEKAHWFQPRISREISDDDEDDDDKRKEARKRKLEEFHEKQKISRSCTICLQYNGMLYMNFLGPKEMVVVEQPWLEVVETFPDAIHRRIYGCS
jgi:hypothetical protein